MESHVLYKCGVNSSVRITNGFRISQNLHKLSDSLISSTHMTLCESHCVEAALCPQVQSKGEELQSTRSQLSMMETDLHAAEKERDGLAKKVEMLERALESPGSKVALRRILER